MHDLFQAGHEPTSSTIDYSAKDIEVLEGLEPVRRRPGMFIGGTDERALHHLVAELLDNSMDEAVAGHADWIELRMDVEGGITVKDNGRGIPTDPHPKFPDKSALEVILTTLHSGGKFSNKAYQTAGGLHGVGVSVVNALAEELVVEVARNKTLWRQLYVRGKPETPLTEVGPASNRRGTLVTFKPDPEIFGASARFKPSILHRLARSKAYLFRGVEIRWHCDPALIEKDSGVPERETFHFPKGLEDFLHATLAERICVTEAAFSGQAQLENGRSRVEWAIAWPEDEEPYTGYYCNTVPTPQGGSHEQALRGAMIRALRSFGELTGQNAKKMGQVTADDLLVQRLRAPLAVHPEPAVPGPDQRQAARPRGRQARRTGAEGPLRPLALRPARGRASTARLCDQSGGRTSRPTKSQGRRAQNRDPETPPSRQARGLLGRRARRHGNLPGGGGQRWRVGQAGARSRDPGDPAAARKNPERGERHR